MKLLHCITVLAVVVVCTSASAQWIWLDQSGRKVFSDRPPPSDIQETNVLKRPAYVAKQSPHDMGGTSDDADTQQAPVKTGATQTTAADKEFAARKKQAAAAELARAQAIREQNEKIKVENCASARQALMDFSSDGRLTHIKPNGEREFLTEAQIASERQRAQKAVDSSCQ